MSSEPPEGRSRIPQPIRIGGGFTFVYAALTVAFAGTAAWLVLLRDAPLTSPQVAVSGIGALWFALRTAMSLSGKR